MMNQNLVFPLFIIVIVLIFFTSRRVIDEIFHLLRHFIRSERIIFIIISLFFLPGTVIHELAHFFMATILMLKVNKVSIFPSLGHGFIRLGSVEYEKKDPLRGILVGVAPIFVGLVFFYLVNITNIFFSQGIILDALFIYLIFAISSTMFSSKQDLIDVIYIIPLLIIITIISLIFHLQIGNLITNKAFLEGSVAFVSSTNRYLFLSLLINLLLLIVFRGLRFIIRR